MITDRMTARVLGMVVLLITFLIDCSCFMFARPEVRTVRFAAVVILPSLPLLAVGLLLLRKAARMKDEDEGEA